ncbi:MAG: UvrD/REP helicase [Acidobacteriaceae bacterium]|nr:UvrD/REP helicase [Acidobacteriaceae bacterium]
MSNLFVMGQDLDGSERAISATGGEGLPPDVAERERALDVSRSWIVEAPAGSGKTGLLIQRYLKLLAEESVMQPGQVLAITFTKKAAAEIRERVLAQLESAQRGDAVKEARFERETRAFTEAVLEKDRRLEWGLLENPQRMNLKTIDSLCAVIAGSMPVLSGGGGGITPVEDAMPLYQAAARRTVMQFGGDDAALNDALREVLLHRDGNLVECERLLAEMLALRDQWGELIPLRDAELNDAYLDGTVLPKLEQTLEQMVCAGLTQLAESVPRDFLEEVAALAASFAEIAPYDREVSPLAACLSRSVPGTDVEHLEHWRALIHLLVTPSSWTWRKGFAKNHLGFETTKAEKDRLKRVLEQIAHRDDLLEAMQRVDRLPPAQYPEEQWRVAKALFRLLSRALVELQFVFAERGECDFAELALLARGALRQTGGVLDLQEALGMEFRHLLVDEMQDTSTIQYELIELLTQEWDGERQTVFLVGDPKQSIYLFRQARVERFVRTMQEQRMGDLPVECLRLTANFRSQTMLVTAFNADFSLLFPRAEDVTTPDEVPYDNAAAVRSSAYSDVGMEWHTRVIEARRFSPEAKAESRHWLKDEAQMVRAIAKDWRGRPLPAGRTEPWKIAVLVQGRRHLLDIVGALKEDDGDGSIPFTAVKIDALAERQEVMDLFALTRALLHPADRVAWLAVLRAPWCGLSLVDLHAIAGGDDPLMVKRVLPELMIEREHLLSEEGKLRLVRVRSVLQTAESQRLKTAAWVERTWRSLGGDVSLDDAELGNARRYLQLLDEVEKDANRVEVPVLRRRMEKLYAQAVQSAGAVDLMTIHGAKGLEWDVVMVPGLARQAGISRSGLLVWNEVEGGDENAARGMLAPIAGRGEPAKELNRWMKGLRDAREAAERKRLFYVACTRAREELHLFAAPERGARGEILRASNSLLKAAWPAAERHFVDAPGAKVLPFGVAAPLDDTGDAGLTIAAVEEAVERPPMLQRLPLSFDPASRFASASATEASERRAQFERAYFERPEGSFAARAFGNAVHGFLELVTKRMAAGVSVDALVMEAATWTSRVEAVLRGDGLPPSAVQREAQRVIAALQTALQDEAGLWVLGARKGAASEFGFTTWTEKRRSFRLDRVFVAGPEPLAPGSDCLWIVDYKTGTHGRGVGVDAFLASEREKYGAQMESYARAMAADAEGKELRVGLYYPMLPKLLWWKPSLA